MVQQIASVKTESAASSLPFSLSSAAVSVQSETRQSFNNELLRQADSIRAFEPPRQPNTENVDNSRSNNSDNIRQRQNSSMREDNNTKKHHDNDNEASKKSINNKDEKDAFTQKSKQKDEQSSAFDEARARIEKSNNKHDSLKTDRPKNDIHENDIYENEIDEADGNTTIKSNNPVNVQTLETAEDLVIQTQQNVKSHVSDTIDELPAEQELIADTPQELLPSDESHTSDHDCEDCFDYIDYVTSVVDYTASEVNVGEPLTTAIPIENLDDLFNTDIHNTPPSLSQEELQVMREIIENGEIASTETLSSSNTNELLELTIPSINDVDATLTISRDDLQILIDAKQHLVNETEPLPLAQKTEVDNILNEIVKQLELTSSTVNSAPSEQAALLAADKALLQELLVNNQPPPKPDANVAVKVNEQVSSSSQSRKTVPLALQQATPQNNQVDDIAANTPEVFDLVLETPEQQISKDRPKTTTIDIINTVDALEGKVIHESKKAGTEVSTRFDLVELHDQQAKAALDNLSQRVQLLTSDAGHEFKGNEFIAALQSGVKEFKQQLAQGKEPAIELKAIVAEALAQISGETTASAKSLQPKIDTAVNQFNAALNLANAINHAATQQQTQAIATHNNELAKEINFSHIEGTKLANGVQSQVNAQASIDKAINIFKQEGQQQLAEKVRWMVNAKNATAEIRLDPPDLGGINIKINLSGDTAQVNFNVQSSAAKDALDSAIPRLREMLQDQGIELGESTVNQDSQSRQQGSEQGREQSGSQSSSTPSRVGLREGIESTDVQASTNGMAEQRISNGALGGIDYYA